MKMLRAITATSLLLSIALFIGCEVSSPTDVQRNVGANFTGFYTRTGSSNETVDIVVGHHSGASILSLDLRQNGDRLEAIDNHNIIFKGSVGDFINPVASFTLEGHTTAGNKATISGTLTASGGTSSNSSGSTEGTMQGTWIEDSLFATVRAEASIPGVRTTPGNGGGGGSGPSISSNPSTITTVTGTSVLSVSGGTSPYSWQVVSGGGSVSPTPTAGSQTTTYSRNSAASGTAIIKVTDFIGRQDSISITLQ